MREDPLGARETPANVLIFKSREDSICVAVYLQ